MKNFANGKESKKSKNFFLKKELLEVPLRAKLNTNGSCGIIYSNTVTINLYTVPNASASNQSICSGQTSSVLLSNPNGVSGTTFSWTSSQYSGTTVSGHSSGNGSTILQTLSVSGNTQGVVRYTVTPISNGCSGTFIQVDVTVHPVPNAAAGNQTICTGQTTSIVITNPNSVSGTSFAWTSSQYSGATVTGFSNGSGSSIAQTLNVSQNTQGVVRYTITPTASSCNGTPVTADVTVNPKPTLSLSATAQSIFSGSATQISLSNPNSIAGTLFRWTASPIGVTGASNQSTLVSGPIAQTLTLSSPNVQSTVDYSVKAVSPASCESSATTGIVTVITRPAVTASAQSISMGQPVTLDGGANNLTYQWKNSVNTIVGTSRYYTTATPGYYTLTVTRTGITGSGASFPFYIHIGLGGLNMNYIISNSILKEGVTEAGIDTLSVKSRSQTIQYFDGLGRPVQSVTTQGSPLKKDIVQPIVYDDFGRVHRKYLPAVLGSIDGWYKDITFDGAGNYAGEAANFYSNNPTGKIAQDTRPFSETMFEASPLNRPLKNYGPGQAWSAAGNNKFVEQKYLINVHGTAASATSEKVIAWKVDATTGMPARCAALTGYIETDGYFSTGQLFVNVTVDEQGNAVREYKDKQGQVVLKKVQVTTAGATNLNDLTGPTPGWALTYYLYDDFGNLRYVFPPELSKLIHANAVATYIPTTTELSNWAFQYKYDERKRMVEKQVPGAGAVYMVYDQRDRLVLTQDAKQRSTTTDYWSFTKYDELNRPILTGIKDTTDNVSRDSMQIAVNNFYAAIPSKPWRKWGETYVGNITGNLHGYSNKSYPVVTGPTTTIDKDRYLSVTYYDNYLFRDLWVGTYTYLDENLSEPAHGITYNQPDVEFTRVIGLVTGTKIKVLDGGVTGGYTWLKSVNYYDDKYRMIQSLSDNYKGGTDRVTNVYDFVGKVLKTKSTHEEKDVTWKDLASVKQEGNKLISVSGPAQWGFGAASVQELAAGQDGWFEFIVTETTTGKMIGFNDSNTGGTSNADINYVFQLYYSTLYIQENASVRATVTGIVPGDVLRLERVGSTITFKRNGATITTPALASSTTSLFIDNSFHLGGNTIAGVRASFATTTRTTTRRFEYDHAGRLLKTWHEVDEPIQWQKVSGLAADHATSSLVKTSTVYGWNSGASTSVFIEAGANGWAECKPAAVDPFFGLASADPNAGYTSINYAIYFEAGNQVNIYESGVFKGRLATFTSADLFRVERINGVVFYKKNGVTFYTSATPSTGPLLLDTSFDYPGGRLSDIKLSSASGNILLALNEYNELGELVTKKLHSTDNGSTFKQHVDLRYNIRGWLTRINNSDLTPDGNEPRDHFGMDIAYNDVFSGVGNTPQYNGNISATKYSTNQGFDPGLKERAYKYDYDALSRLTAATHYEKSTGWNMSGGLHEDNISYNLNTSILSIRRKGADGSQMDNLAFTYTGNQLQTVTDSWDTQKGFEDGNTVGADYTYDANGNRITDKNKGITAYTYNYMNQREKVTFSDGNYLLYTYDAAGNKLSQGVYNSSNVLQKKTDYVGEFFYENDTLKYISHEEGRYNVLAGAYEYELRDHLGNNRVTFTTKEEHDEATATMETANLTAEQGKFLRYENARRISSHLFDKTNGNAPSTTPGYAVRLSGSTNERFGLARSFAVVPGDTVKAEVYVKYIDSNSSNWTTALNTLLTQIAGGTAPAGTVVDGGSYGSSTTSFPYAGLLNTSGSSGTGPKAYLNWLVFDNNFVLVNGGFVRMSDAAREYGQDCAHEYLSAEIPIITAGFVYVYLSNENESIVDVFYDQFSVELRKSPVINATDLFAYGAPAISYTRELSLKQDRLLNGKETQDELGYNVVDLGQRDIDPFVPVFPTIDRFAEKYYSISPYQYTAGNPVAFVDINGDSLWINYKGTNVLYQNGVLYNKDGTAYTGAGAKKDKNGTVTGYKGFLGQAFNALNQISSAEAQTGTSVLSGLQSSSNNFTIADAAGNPRGAGQNEFVSDNKNGEYATAMLDAGQGRPQQGGSGGTVYWNPNGSDPLNGVSELGGGVGMRPTTNLAHELFHGYDSDRGLGDNRPVNGLKRSEWRAAYFENQVRLQMRLPLRESYNLRTGPVRILTPVTIFNNTYQLPTPVDPPTIGWLQYIRLR